MMTSHCTRLTNNAQFVLESDKVGLTRIGVLYREVFKPEMDHLEEETKRTHFANCHFPQIRYTNGVPFLCNGLKAQLKLIIRYFIP